MEQINSSGLPGAPVEILWLIVSHFRHIPVPFDPDCYVTFYHEGIEERCQSLLALSHTCGRLRKVLLPVMCRKFEVVTKVDEDEKLGCTLRQMLGIVTNQDLDLAREVQEVSVFFPKSTDDVVKSRSVEALTTFPNLKTLQLMDADGLVKCFTTQASRFPSITTLTLRPGFHEIFKYFPNVESFYSDPSYLYAYCGLSHSDNKLELFDQALTSWMNIVVIGGLTITTRELQTLSDRGKSAAYLRSISLVCDFYFRSEIEDRRTTIAKDLKKFAPRLEIVRIVPSPGKSTTQKLSRLLKLQRTKYFNPVVITA